MIELPEATVLARQINDSLVGKRIITAKANESPHRFAWYTGDPEDYGRRLAGSTVERAETFGGYVETRVGDRALVTNTQLRLHVPGAKLPANRQLLVGFSDGTALTGHVHMWGALLCLDLGQDAGLRDYNASKAKPSPLTRSFSERYFRGLLDDETRKLTAKAFLATEQRVPGLGNGVLQDILWAAHVHPKRPMESLSPAEVTNLHSVVQTVLAEMAHLGGRDTEKDLFGNPGRYRTILSAKTAALPCPSCGGPIAKEAYLGGSIYFCPTCQPVR